jgi:putative transposase
MNSSVKMKKFIDICLKEKTKIKHEYDNFYEKITMMEKIIKFKNDIWLPSVDIQLTKINSGTCFDIAESNIHKHTYIKHNIDFDLYNGEMLKAKKIYLVFNSEQQKIVKKWINAYRKMYNETLKYIKNEYVTTKKITLNWMKMRKILKDTRDGIVSKSGNSKNEQIKVHDIDYAIKLACQNYKSALTNKRLGYIKSFRIRYWEKNKEKQILDLEKDNFKSGSLRKKVLGNIKGYYNGKEYDFCEIKKDSRLVYAKGSYYLYVTEDIKKENIIPKRNIISLDPGIRKFLTGITENRIVEVGKDIKKKLDIHLNNIQKIKNRNEIQKKTKKKIERRNNKKIENKVDEMHWKTISYLTKNYKKILIGNMSTKSIISNTHSNNLYGRIKEIAQRIKLYEFRKRLEYKCEIRGIQYKCVDERYTSKMCSNCGNIKEDLGSNEIYSCNNCGTIIGRDVTGSRLIYIKSITD